MATVYIVEEIRETGEQVDLLIEVWASESNARSRQHDLNQTWCDDPDRYAVILPAVLR